MRARNIKPGFFINEVLAEVEPLGRILFIGLWSLADREGRLEDRPRRIKAEVLPYDDCDVDALLDNLARRDFILRYQVDGNRYIQVANFDKHQRPHQNEKESEIPAPTVLDEPSEAVTLEDDTDTRPIKEASPSHQGNKCLPPREQALRSDSLIPDTGYLNADTGVPEEIAPDRPARTRRRDPVWDALAAECGYPETDSEKADFGKTVKELKQARASPAEIAAFAVWWVDEMPEHTMLTHRCYRRHWSKFKNGLIRATGHANGRNSDPIDLARQIIVDGRKSRGPGGDARRLHHGSAHDDE